MRPKIKYDRHDEVWVAISAGDGEMLASTWLRTDTLDYWRHTRLRKFLIPLIKHDCNCSWLTVGDGRYGSDAHFLLSEGATNVHASDYSDILLRLGFENDFINEYSAQNAEALDFPDDSFDYVLCKDALHHFPRPFTALDEMFRVARKGVVIIEPRDKFIDRSFFQVINTMLRVALGRDILGHGFESIGNYVYSISERELEKFMLGRHSTNIFFAGVNDAYFPGVEFVPYPPKKIKDIYLSIILKTKIVILNFLQKAFFSRSGVLVACLMKSEPSCEIIFSMKKSKWVYKKLPQNPFL